MFFFSSLGHDSMSGIVNLQDHIERVCSFLEFVDSGAWPLWTTQNCMDGDIPETVNCVKNHVRESRRLWEHSWGSVSVSFAISRKTWQGRVLRDSETCVSILSSRFGLLSGLHPACFRVCKSMVAPERSHLLCGYFHLMGKIWKKCSLRSTNMHHSESSTSSWHDRDQW